MSEFADILADAFGAYGEILGVQDATLTKFTPGTRTPGAASGGTNPTPTVHPCIALVQAVSLQSQALLGALVNAQDRMISIFGGSLPAGVIPEKNDEIAATDLDGKAKVFRVLASPPADPVGGVWTCQARA